MERYVLRKEKVDLRFPADRRVGGPGGLRAAQQIPFRIVCKKQSQKPWV